VDPVEKFVFKNFTKSKNAARIWPNLSTLKAKNKAVVPESNRERSKICTSQKTGANPRPNRSTVKEKKKK
jgi:hypothetical protein